MSSDAGFGEALAAGCIAGALGQLIGFPLDTLKVRMQLGGGAARAPLMQGWNGPVLTSGAVQAVNFGVYDWARRSVSGDVPDTDSSLPTVFLAGSLGGLAISPMVAVITRVKILQQTGHGVGLLATVRATAAAGGIRSHGLGFALTALMESCRGFYMVFFVGFKRSLGNGE